MEGDEWFSGGMPDDVFRSRLQHLRRPALDTGWLHESAPYPADEDREPELIEGILPSKGVVGLVALRQAFKSFVALDMLMHVAYGADWFGRKVNQGPVVYIAAEDAEGMKDRRIAWFKAHPQFKPEWLEGGMFRPFGVRPNLGIPGGDTRRLIESIQPAAPRLIVIDTVSKVLHGADEWKEGMVSLLDNAEDIANAFDCVVMLVHHAKRQEKGNIEIRGRGADQFGANGQGEITLRRIGKKMETLLTVARHKGYAEGARLTVKMSDPIFVREDRNGKRITSLVIESVGVAPDEETKAEAKAKAKAKVEAEKIQVVEVGELSQEDRVRKVLLDHPEAKGRELSRITGIAQTTVRRILERIKAEPKPEPS